MSDTAMAFHTIQAFFKWLLLPFQLFPRVRNLQTEFYTQYAAITPYAFINANAPLKFKATLFQSQFSPLAVLWVDP